MICVVKIWNGAFHDPIGHDDKKKPSFPARIVRVGQSLHNYKVSWLQGRVVSTFPCFVASSGLVWCLHVDTIQISFYQGCQTPFVKKERGWEVVKHMHSNSDVQGEVATTTRKCPQFSSSVLNVCFLVPSIHNLPSSTPISIKAKSPSFFTMDMQESPGLSNMVWAMIWTKYME